MASSSSLNNVVSSLVRASMGASVPQTVTDEDLDRHVAELILKEAKAKAEKYAKDGIGAYLPNAGLPENNLPKANKRFLNSLVKNVSEHNRVILQAQAESAEQIKEAKRQEEMQDRRRRAEEATSDRMRLQRLMGQGTRGSRGHPRDRDGESSSRRYRSRSPRRRDRDSPRSRTPRNRSRSPRRSESPPRRHRSPRDDDRRSDRKRERSLSHKDDRPSKRHSHRDRFSKHAKVDREDKESSRGHKDKGKEKERVDSDRTDEGTPRLSDSVSDTPRKLDSPSRSPSPEYQLPDDNAPSFSSKMDKYFSPTYDPRLDVTQPTVSKSGLLEGPQWEGWEGMLEVMRVRAMDKEEKKRRAKEDKEKSKFDKKRAKEKAGTSIPIASSASFAPISEVGLMDMTYKKRGATKEWDLAKETPT